ncbi:MFS transporter [Pseudonocardia petroleophila]|uniref:MFS transporter n=1 Tax=Pseudonocardia petroleophila TaxID=37331 RepID=A0A7G7MGG5_9PSEU|nr:MFS transporter [Pseudonocardia petroleophila]QNG51876.1 MFS transporter [Pseudonocardia petroleophila]
MDTSTSAEPRAGTREWLGLAVLALPTLLVSMDVSVLHLAVPAITSSLSADAGQMLWIIDIYGFMIAGFLVTMGTLGDRIGRRKLLLIGGAAFGAASVLAAFATSPEMLIASRALLGVAGATLMPSTLSLIVNMFRSDAQRGVAIAVWVTMFSLGTALGPVVGGALLEFFWWGSVFLLAVPVMVLLLVAGPILLPEYRDADAGRIDLLSVALSLAALLPVIYGLKGLATGASAVTSIAAIVLGVVFAVVFALRQRTLASPLLDMSLFRQRAFAVTAVAMLASMFIAGGTYLFVTQYLQLVTGLSPMQAGLWLLPAAGALIVTSMLAPALAAKIKPHYVVVGGLLISTVGQVVLATLGTDDLALLVIGFLLVYAGGGPMISLGTDLIIGSAPPEQAGSASSISETATELGMALGVAALGSLGTAVYRGLAVVPAGTPADLAAAAQDTLASAAAAVQGLPAEVAAALLDPNRAAFVGGLNVLGWVCAALSVALAALMVLGNRETPAAAATPEGVRDEVGAV